MAEERVERHTTSQQEIDDLRGIVARNLHDASLPELSDDNRFGLAYEAALLLGKITIACAGYRVKTHGGAHVTTFLALPVAMGKSVEDLADYFDRCRRKRNELSYDAAGVTTRTEAEEILNHARQFQTVVEAWIAKNHPQFR